MNAITLLKEDHRRVKDLFRRFEATGTGARKAKARLVEQMTKELSEHAAIEETVFYPEARRLVPKSEADVLEGLEEHHIVKWTLHELEGMKPTDERYDAKVTVLIESVRHHMREEEQELFPEISRVLSRAQLNELGDALDAARAIAPKHPHPSAPDEPPGNLVAAMATAPVDALRERVGDAVGALAGRRR